MLWPRPAEALRAGHVRGTSAHEVDSLQRLKRTRMYSRTYSPRFCCPSPYLLRSVPSSSFYWDSGTRKEKKDVGNMGSRYYFCTCVFGAHPVLKYRTGVS